MKEILAAGYAVIDRIDNCDYLGGAAAGVALNGRRLGLETGLMTVFGDDPLSDLYVDELTKWGVDLNPSQVITGSTLPVNELSHSDRTTGWTNDGVTIHMQDMPIDDAQINQYQVVHVASSHFSVANNIAKRYNEGIISYSPGPKLRVSLQYLSMNALRKSELVFLNEEEWHCVAGALNLDQPTELLEYGPEIAVTSHGATGLVVSYRDIELVQVNIPPKTVDKTEPTGAGDALALGFIVGYINKLPPQTCAEMGALLASHALQRNGVMLNASSVKSFAEQAKDLYSLHIG